MALGDTIENGLGNAIVSRLDPWLRNPPDYDDVSTAYKKRGQLTAKRAKLVQKINRAETDVVIESNNPRSNITRVAKLEASQELRNELAELDAQIAIVENEVKLLEYRLNMYKVASYQMKNTLDL